MQSLVLDQVLGTGQDLGTGQADRLVGQVGWVGRAGQAVSGCKLAELASDLYITKIALMVEVSKQKFEV